MELFPVGVNLRKFLDNQQVQKKLTTIIKEFEDQASHPPGSDLIIQACYQAVTDHIKENTSFRKLIVDVIRQRFELSEKHFVNLFFRSLQYIELLKYKDISSYLSKYHKSKEGWLKDIQKILSDSKDKDLLLNLLLTKDTSTTKYQRYISLYALINWFFPKKSVKVADFGCGGNYGLRGIEIGEKFESVEDQTKNKFFTRLLQKKATLGIGLGIDKENPDNLENHNWIIACSFYPEELIQLKSVLEFERRIAQSKKVRFLEADLTKVPLKKNTTKDAFVNAIPRNYFDVVIISTMLYQTENKKAQRIIIEKAKKSLIDGGVLILQDFVRLENNGKLDFSQSWFNTSYSYRTLMTSAHFNWHFLEVFQWENGRCLKVKNGRDLSKILNLIYFSNTSKAALAHSVS